MTLHDEGTKHTLGADAPPCDCGACSSGDLPVNPFVALRVAYGMLLGEEDFRVLMGNPRGKQMLHSAWLHGSGVVWGYDVVADGAWSLRIGEGLAIDGMGRELLNDSTACVDVRKLVDDSVTDDDEGCATQTIHACVVVEFDSCLSAPVPTLADPCDVTRKHDDYSRVVERVRFSVRDGCCRSGYRPYHRVRVLLGLDCVGTPDPSGHEALEARRAVAAAPAGKRPHQLLEAFRTLAALDSIDRHPAVETGDCYPTLFPVDEDGTAVALACVDIRVRVRDGCPEIMGIDVDPSGRDTLLPTATIQELACGLAPGVISGHDGDDGGGPQVIGEEVSLSKNGRQLIIPVTAPLAHGSVPGSVRITSLSAGRAGGWVAEDIYDTRYDTSRQAIVVELADRPVNNLIRVIVDGTGPKPVMGADPAVPLAGVVGGPAGTRHDGHDAVWTFANPVPGRGDAESPDQGGGQDAPAPGAEQEEAGG
jgi:hypothetical protein